MRCKKIPIALFCTVVLSSIVFAQMGNVTAEQSAEVAQTLQSAVGEIVRVRTIGGGEFQGLLISYSEDRVELQSGEGLILQVVTDEISNVLVIDQTADASAYYQDAASNKLIVIPVGFGMDPKEFHVANQEVVLVTSSYGFSERFSLWGGLSIPGAVLNARWSFEPSDSLGISSGAFAGALFIDGGVIFIPYLITTIGTPDENFTIALGAPYFNESLVDYSNFFTGGVAVLGGKKVLSQTASLITENWVLVLTEYWQGEFHKPRIVVAPAVAFRIAGSRFSWDIGITYPFWISNFYDSFTDSYGGYSIEFLEFPIPILGFTYRIQ